MELELKESRYQWQLILGDESSDGHGQVIIYTFSSLKPLKEVEKVYDIWCKSVRHTLKDICSDSGECEAPKWFIKDLLKRGWIESMGDLDNDFNIEMAKDAFMFLLNTADASLDVEEECLEVFKDSFGYGLFAEDFC